MSSMNPNVLAGAGMFGLFFAPNRVVTFINTLQPAGYVRQ